MTKKQLQARVAELEATIASLNAAITAMASKVVYVGPIPTQPTVNPLPIFPQPYIGDPPYPWGGSPSWGGNKTAGIGGLQSSLNTAQCRMGLEG